MNPPKATRLRSGDVLVVDYDKTLADEHGVVPGEAKAALDRWRAAGGIVIDNTGRRAGDFLQRNHQGERLVAENSPPGADRPPVFPDLADHVDYVVAENGAVIIDVANDRMLMLGEHPPSALLAAIKAERAFVGKIYTSPYRVQCVKTEQTAAEGRENGDPNLLGDPNVARLAQIVKMVNAQCGSKLHVAQNIDSLMVLPDGVDKASGLMKAIALARGTGFRIRRIVGAGDAINDLPFLDACDCSFGVEGGERLSGKVDFISNQKMGHGVAEIADATRTLRGTGITQLDRSLSSEFRASLPWHLRMSRRALAPEIRKQAAARLAAVESRAPAEERANLGLGRMADLYRQIGEQGLGAA